MTTKERTPFKRKLTPRARWRLTVVFLIELAVVCGLMIGTMAALGFICAVAGVG